MKWLMFCVVAALFVSFTSAEGEIWEEDDHEVLIRNERGTKNREECRYGKGAWSECDPKTNMRSRSLTLKKGNQTTCEATKTIQKKCKKACRYEKGTWGECNAQSMMTRTDKIKPNSDASCEQNRQITKKCKPKGAKPTKGNKGKKGKAARRNRQ
ncbi:midkine-like isoform X1 [Harmonia axyridis]|uniref:midkine-like isoform X1 n=1 Tax=Harmonia axyridis TaxID=115357 RepID=UPI001E276A6A|nr:midkine-like isoform X1 [Harmonia axyridis]XP_045464549.1 midkine-like isoform X1 [Harmonia axyridis]